MVHHTTKIAREDAHREWETKKAEWEKEKADLEKEKADLQRRLEEGNNKAKTTESECDKLREKMEELEQSLSQEKEGKKTLQKKYNQLEQDMEREFNESKTEWENDYKKLIKKHTKEKEQLLKAITSLTVEKDNLLTSLEEGNNKAKTTESECDKLREKMEELEQSLSKEKEDNKMLQKKYNQLEQVMEREFNESKTEWENDYKKLIKKHTKEKEQLLKAITSLTVEKDNLLTRGAVEQHTKKRAWENANVERDKEKAEWKKEKADLQREMRQLQVENEYLKLILDDLHKSIIVGEATRQMELKPPEDIQNDKLLTELTTNTRKIHFKFYELETELDYIHRTISKLTSMIVGDDRSKDPIQEKTNKFTATGRQPKRNPAKTFEQREQSSKIDKDIELVTSALRHLKEKEIDLTASKQEMAKTIKEYEQNYEKLRAEHQNLNTAYTTLQKRCNENNAWNTIASDRLTHEHVNIADLNDADRPTKLQEGYSELYDNEWTVALEELIADDDITENFAIIILLKILMSSFQNCREITWGRYERLKNVASYIEQEISLPSPKIAAKGKVEKEDPSTIKASKDEEANKKGKKRSKENVESRDANVSEASKDKFVNKKGKEEKLGATGEEDNILPSIDLFIGSASYKNEILDQQHLKCTIDLNFELTYDIKGIWRKTSHELKRIAAEPLCSLIETCLDMPFVMLPMTSKYLKRCIDLCWKMGVQEKPLHLDGFAEMDAYAGKKFDKDKFRSYALSGSHIDFVVWPTLYLYEGGPILVKGIVQCCSSVEAKLKSLHN